MKSDHILPGSLGKVSQHCSYRKTEFSQKQIFLQLSRSSHLSLEENIVKRILEFRRDKKRLKKEMRKKNRKCGKQRKRVSKRTE